MIDSIPGKECKIKEEHILLLREMGENFTIRYRFLDLKSHPDFKDLPQMYKNNLRAWYSYNRSLNYKEKEVKSPKELTPNQRKNILLK